MQVLSFALQQQGIGVDEIPASDWTRKSRFCAAGAWPWKQSRPSISKTTPILFLFRLARKPWDMSKPDVRELLDSSFRGAINISRLGHTDIIQVFATSKNPQLASLIANTLIDRYIEHSFRENYAATDKISSWLDEKLNGLKANLEQSQSQHSRTAERNRRLWHRSVP